MTLPGLIGMTGMLSKRIKDPDSNRKACIQVVGDASYALGALLDQEAEEKKEKS